MEAVEPDRNGVFWVLPPGRALHRVSIVDHFYPLKGKAVSGLHVAENLRVIPAFDNLSKHNKMPDEALLAKSPPTAGEKTVKNDSASTKAGA